VSGNKTADDNHLVSIEEQPDSGAKLLAFCLPNLAGGGAERVALTLIKHFVNLGHKVDLMLAQAEGELLPLVPPEVRIIDLKARRLRDSLGGLWRYLRREKPDVLLVSMWPLTIVGILAHRFARSKTRLVVCDHAVLSDHYQSESTRRIIAMSIRWLYPLAYRRVAVSEGAARDLARLSRLSVNCFSVIHNPVSFPDVVSRSPEVESLWAGAGKRVLTLGQLKEEKNQALLVRAFARLPESLDAKLMIVGSGPLLGSLRSVARDLHVADRVIFAGYAADPWPFYFSADLFVLSSREESFGNVLVEAMYAGLPVLSTATTGAIELLDNGFFGSLVEQNDVEALASGMAELLRNPPAGSQRGRAIALSGANSLLKYQELLLGQAAA